MPDEIVRSLRRPPGVAGRRVPVNWPAEVRFNRLRRACVVIDISRAGASIRMDGLPEGVSELRLVLDTAPPIAAALAWRTRNRIGLRFLSEQEWLDELGRRRFDAAAWLDQP